MKIGDGWWRIFRQHILKTLFLLHICTVNDKNKTIVSNKTITYAKFIICPGPVEWILSRGGPNTMNGAGQTEIPEFTL